MPAKRPARMLPVSYTHLVLAKGDTIKAAERLFCHKNTIRYRIGKLQEKVDPLTNEKEFYQNLAAAIKVYLLLNKIKKQEEEK